MKTLIKSLLENNKALENIKNSVLLKDAKENLISQIKSEMLETINKIKVGLKND
jgi:hypothetical protein